MEKIAQSIYLSLLDMHLAEL